jgi:hypothetical protein
MGVPSESRQSIPAAALAVLIWLVLLIAMFWAPTIEASERGEALTRNTVRLSLLYWFGAILLRLRLTGDDWAGGSARWQLARCCWTLAWATFLVHLATALHYYDGWSHAAAVERTHAATGFGAGIWFSHLFTLLWTVDVAWWWLQPGSYAIRPLWLARAWFAYMAFLIFNSTVVYETGPIRWWGMAMFAVLGLAWYRQHRR